MRFEQAITTIAAPDRAWRAVTAVTTWPLWTTSMTTVLPLDGAEVRVGRRFRINPDSSPG